jgi:GNAT superfamily N-acetyltransferase
VTSFEISTDPSRLDVDLIHGFLTTSYWAEGRSRDTVERSLRHSLCFGVYSDGRQVAFGRVITDGAVFAYLADVFVIPAFRGRGIAKALVGAVLEHPDLQGVKVFLLRTRDAHGLYRQFGFQAVTNPEELMGKYS